MHSIGNREDAQAILSWVRGFEVKYGRPKCTWRSQAHAPEGWEFLGSGCARSVWRSPAGVAYKVGHQKGSYQNEQEIKNLAWAWNEEVPAGCRLPRFDRFEVDDETVIVIEAIEGMTLSEYSRKHDSSNGYYSLMNEIEHRFRLGDMHDENCLVDKDGLLVPVDFGC